MRKALFLAVLFLCPPQANAFDSTFVDIDDGTFNDLAVIPRFVRNMRELGMWNLIIAATATKGSGSDATCYRNTMRPLGSPSTYDATFAKVRAFAVAAKLHGMNLIVGGAVTMMACPGTFHTNTANRQHAAGANQYLASRIEILRREFPGQIVGIYLPDEVSWGGPEYYEHVRAQVQAVRTRSNLPVFVSPFLGYATQWLVDPGYIANQAASFMASTGVTGLLYQDSAGAAAANLDYGTAEPNVEQYFQRLSAKNGWRVSAIVETFNYGSAMGLGSPNVARVNNQLWQTRSARESYGLRTTWIAQTHMNLASGMPAWSLPYHRQAPRLYHEVKALKGLGGRIHSYRYHYLSNPPYASAPDNYGTKLRDWKAGNGRKPFDGNWVGLPPGGLLLQADLGKVSRVDFISLQTLGLPAWAIRVPTNLYARFSSNGVTWSGWRTFPTESGALGSTGEHTLANPTALGVSARYVQVAAYSFYFVFAGELTFSSIY